MGLFGSKAPHTFLGVDIGASGLKVVELANEKGRAKLMTYGYTERKPDQAALSPFDDTKATGELLAKLCRQCGVKGNKVMAALPLSSVFSAIVSVPRRKTEKEMQPLVDAQIGKLTPIPLTEMVTYATFIDGVKSPEAKKGETGGAGEKEAKPSDHVRVLVTGAAKSLVQKYIEIFRVAKLELQAIDTEAFALVRSLIGKDKSPIAILDVGSMRTNVTVVERGVPVLTRSINIGGAAVTRRIMDQMSVPEAEAEQMKMDLGNMAGASGGVGGLPAVLDAVMQPLLNEIRYAFQLYAGQELTEFEKVEKIVLTGGSSHLPRVVEFLKESLNMNVYRGDPWARVVFPEDLRPVLDEIGPRMAISIGLGMREID